MNKYRSKFEERAAQVLKGCPYEPRTIEYEKKETAKYTPDFERTVASSVSGVKFNYTILYECKGRFRDRAEANKYIHIRNSLREMDAYYQLVFIFQNPKVAMPGVRKRKDGTKQTVSEWADRHGFRWCTLDAVITE